MKTTETFPLDVTGYNQTQIANQISMHIDAQRKAGRKFLGGILVDLCVTEKVQMPPQPPDNIKSVKYIMMSYEGEQ